MLSIASHALDHVFFHARPQSPRSFWPAAGIERLWEQPRSNHFAPQMKTSLNRMGRIRLFPLLFQNGCSQSSRFLPQDRRLWGREWYFQDGGMNACVVFKSGQLTQSYAPTAKTPGSFIKMSSSVELQPAPSSFKSKMWKDFGFKVLYDAQGVRNVEKEIVICRHCFSELRYVSCIVSWYL